MNHDGSTSWSWMTSVNVAVSVRPHSKTQTYNLHHSAPPSVAIEHEKKVTSDCRSRLWIGSRIQPSRMTSQMPFARQMAMISPTLFSSHWPVASSSRSPSPKVSLLVQRNSAERMMKNVWCSKATNSKNVWQKIFWEYHLRCRDKVNVICWLNLGFLSWQVNCWISISQVGIENVWRMALPSPKHIKHRYKCCRTKAYSKTSRLMN